MASQWLNVFVAQPLGTVPESPFVEVSDGVQLNGASVRILETDRSGVVRVTAVTPQSTQAVYGNAEVFLTITFQDGSSRYLSAPLHTPVDVANVASLRLGLIFDAGSPGTSYRALVNAHCVYEIL